MNQKKIDALSQRERKYATTKTKLLAVLLEELETKNLSKIMIKDLARKANVSEPTFFNYFSSKQDMLYYFIQLWATQMNSIAKEAEAEYTSYIEIIISIFRETSHYISTKPQMMLEIIAFSTLTTELKPHNISAAEKWLYFPGIKDVEKFDDKGLESIVPPLLLNALEANELPKNSNLDEIFLSISALFFGTALLLLKGSPQLYPSVLEKQLKSLFKEITC